MGLLWVPLGRQLRSLGALLGALGRSWESLETLLDALGTLFARSWALLGALGRSWDALVTILAPFWTLQGSIFASPRSFQSYFKRILSNLSAQTQTFRKSTESCPGTVREDSKNQKPAALYSQLHPLPTGQEASGPAVFAQRTKYIDL